MPHWRRQDSATVFEAKIPPVIEEPAVEAGDDDVADDKRTEPRSYAGWIPPARRLDPRIAARVQRSIVTVAGFELDDNE